MTPQRLLDLGIAPALQELQARGIRDTPEARRFVLAIALQESALAHRRQVVSGGAETGPASSFWQFEQGGGCKGVLTHRMVAGHMRAICQDFNVLATPFGLWEGMRYNDIVAAAAARLLIYTLPYKLPETSEEGWKQYLSAWRPGKPHERTWADCWEMAGVATGMKQLTGN